MEQARRLAAEKKYAEAYQALDQLQVKDQARFEAETLGTLRQTLKQQQGDAANREFTAEVTRVKALSEQHRWKEALDALDRLQAKDASRAEAQGLPALRETINKHQETTVAQQNDAEKTAADAEKAAAHNAALGELEDAKRAAADEETDRACKILQQLRNLPDGVLSKSDEADVCGYLGIAYFQHSQDKSRAAEKRKWEGQAALMFREARAHKGKWQLPPGFNTLLLKPFFAEAVK